MPVPSNLNYDMWLGSTPVRLLHRESRPSADAGHRRRATTARAGSAASSSAPGMITGWGAHHLDIAQWGDGPGALRPGRDRGHGRVPEEGPVGRPRHLPRHGPLRQRRHHATSATSCRTASSSSARTAGSGSRAAAYPVPKSAQGKSIASQALAASDPAILAYTFKDGDVRLHVSPKNDHHLDWLTSIQTRQPPVAPAEDGHRACTACLLSHAAMKLGRKLDLGPRDRAVRPRRPGQRPALPPPAPPYGTDAVLASEAHHASR